MWFSKKITAEDFGRAGLTENLPFRRARAWPINRIDPFRLTGRNKTGTIAGLG
jgi:hypothetical protein